MKFVKGYQSFGHFGSVEDGLPATVPGSAEPGADVHGGGASAPTETPGNLPPEYQGDPVFLSASATAELNTIGIPNIEALRNPYLYAIEVHELRFLAVTQILEPQFTVASGQVGVYGAPGAQLGVSLQLGGQQLTRNFVPLNLLCPGQALNTESIQYGTALYNQPGWIAGSHRIKLARPLVLLPGECLQVEFAHRGILQNSISAWVGLLGRLTKKPASAIASRVLPFFCAWTPQPMYQPSALPAALQTSSETDLQNSTGTTLEVLRFVGRVNAVGLYGLVAGDAPPTKPHVPPATQAVGALVATEFTDSPIAAVSSNFPAPDSLEIQMVKSTGIPVIAPGSPFRCVFDAYTRTWELDDTLEPNGYYIAQASLLPPGSNSYVVAASPIYPGVGMYGQREVPL